MAKVIIGIHGLGNKPDKATLTEWWKLSLEEGLKIYGINTELPEFKMAYWADIIYPMPYDSSISDTKNPLFIAEKYTPAYNGFKSGNHIWLKKTLRILGKQLNRIFLTENYALKYPHIQDYILGKYFRELDVYYAEECNEEDKDACILKNQIKQRLVDVLDQHKNDKVMLIGHSMGSIIAFDVLSFVAPCTRIHTFITMGSPLGLPMVVSKIASQYKQNPNGRREMISPPGVYGNWFNLSDVTDKITLNYKLSRNYKFNKFAVKARDFSVINDYHSESGEHNPHKSFGYLRSSQMARIVKDFMMDEE
jgi:hypothetical protein